MRLFAITIFCFGCAAAENDATNAVAAGGGAGSSAGVGGSGGASPSPGGGGTTPVAASGGSAGEPPVPAKGSCELVADFEGPTFPELPWTWGGSQKQALGAMAAHDGKQGLLESEWSINQFVSVGAPGDRLSAWVKGSGAGRAWLGFGSTLSHTYALAFAPNAQSLILSEVPNLYEFDDVATVKAAIAPHSWYKLVAELGSGGLVTGTLYESDGKAVVAQVTHTFSGFVPHGIGVRSFGDTHLDTLEICRPEVTP